MYTNDVSLSFKNMQLMKFISAMFLFAVMFSSCKPADSAESAAENKSENALTALENSVMAIHDEVMPKMHDITNLSNELSSYKANLKENEVGKLEAPDGLDQVLGDLKIAEQGMWDWMKAYSDTKATLQENQLEAFYKKELVSITKVKEDMLSNMEKAQAWIAAHPKK